jgi:hypothetical protein
MVYIYYFYTVQNVILLVKTFCHFLNTYYKEHKTSSALKCAFIRTGGAEKDTGLL